MRAVAILAFAAQLSSAADAAPAPSVARCWSPVHRGDTVASLKQRFGAQARIETVYLAEGESGKALVLYPRDKARRIEVLFNEDGKRQVERVRWEGKGWTAGGLKVGDNGAKVAALNGKPFDFFGFEWDYGGYVTKLNGGKLDKLAGGCTLGIRMKPGPDNGNALMGDGEFKSTDPAFRRHPPVIEQLSLAW